MIKSAPLVSVLMTAYNREKYIAEAIESVIVSTYQNWELIIVDDQSKDRTVEIARSYEAMDKRIRVYINEQNLGDYPNRNKAASYATGKYLKYLDSDDLIYPHGLDVMVRSMETFPEVGLGITSNRVRFNFPLPRSFRPDEVYKQQFLGTGFFFTGPTGTIIRREVFEKFGGLSSVRYTGDYDSWLKFSQTSNVVLFQPALIWWREHDNQEFKYGLDPSRYLKSTTEISIKYINQPDSPLTTSERKLAIKSLKQRQARMFLYYLIKGKISYALKYFKHSSIRLFDIVKGLKKSVVHYEI